MQHLVELPILALHMPLPLVLFDYSAQFKQRTVLDKNLVTQNP